MAEEQADAHQLIHRFLGGPPLAVVGRLVLLSILVGVILAAIGLDPWNIIEIGPRPHHPYLDHGVRHPTLAVAVLPAGRRHCGADLALGPAGQSAA